MTKPTETALEAHEEGCPAERTEQFTSYRPDGSLAMTTRCMDCGTQTVEEVEEV
jgi:hypothetical protein